MSPYIFRHGSPPVFASRSAAQLERAVAALTYLVNECGDDLEKYCAGVQAGEGRLLNCLKKNEQKVSRRCKQALKDTGLK